MRRLADFARDLQADGDTLARLRQDVIGEGVCFDGPFGTRRLPCKKLRVRVSAF